MSSLFAGLVTIDSPRRPSMDVTTHHACDSVLTKAPATSPGPHGQRGLPWLDSEVRGVCAGSAVGALRPDVFESSPLFAGQLTSVPLKLAISCPLARMSQRGHHKSCYKVLGLERWWAFERVIWDHQTDNNEQAVVNFERANICVASIRSPDI